MILNLTRELGVNLAGVEIALNMRRKMEQVQAEVGEFVTWVQRRSSRARPQEGWQERLQQALVRLPPAPGSAVVAAAKPAAQGRTGRPLARRYNQPFPGRAPWRR